MKENAPLTVAENVLDLKNFFVKLNLTTLKFNKDLKEKEEYVKQNSNGFFAMDTEIKVVNSETGIEINRLIRTENNEIIESTQKYVDSPLSTKIINFDVEFTMHFDIGVGFIKFADGSSYYGFIKSDKKEPFLIGIFTDSMGQESVQLDHGLGFGVTAWSKSEKNLSEIIQFLKEHVDKGYLSDIVYSLFIELTFKNDTATIDDEISRIDAEYLNGIAIRTIKTNPLLDLFIISIAKFPLNKDGLLFNLKYKDGSTSSPFIEISLEQLEDLATTVADYYSANGKLIYDVQILAKMLPAQYNHKACEEIFLKYNLPKIAKLYVSSLDDLNNVEFYIKTEPSSEIKKMEGINFQFSIESISGRTGYYFNSLHEFYDIFEQAQRWVGYYMNIALENKDSSIRFNLFTVKMPNVREAGIRLFEKII